MNTKANHGFENEVEKNLVKMLHEHLKTRCSVDQLVNLDNGFVAYLNHKPQVEKGDSKAPGRIKIMFGGGNFVVIWTNETGQYGLAGKPVWFNPKKHSVLGRLTEITEKLAGKEAIKKMVADCYTASIKNETEKLLSQQGFCFEALNNEELEFFLTSLQPYLAPVKPIENDGIRINNGEIYFMGQSCPRKILASLIDTEKLRWTMKHLYPNPLTAKDHQVIIPEVQRQDWRICASHIVSAISECRVRGVSLKEVEALAA